MVFEAVPTTGAVIEYEAIQDRYWRDVEERRRGNAMWDYVDYEVRAEVIRRAKTDWEAMEGPTRTGVAARYKMTDIEFLTESVILFSNLLIHCKGNISHHYK